MEEKTHWLQSPNKNYLGHWDLPDAKDLVVTIVSAQWEEVKNPITNKSESKRVIRFAEKNVKPFICNQTNAQSIVVSTGVKYMEDSKGCKIALYIDNIIDKRTKESVDCIRIRRTNNNLLHEELCGLYELKKKSLSEDLLQRAESIINNKEIESYSKLINHLKTL